MKQALRGWVVLVVIALVATSCTSEREASESVDTSTTTTSDSFDTAAERVEFARNYVTFPGPVDDVYFDIHYFDNSDGRAPGPSDWDMKFVFVVDPETVDAWTEDHIDAEFSTVWANRLLDQAGVRHDTLSEPRQVQRAGSRVTVYADEGIVIRQVSTLF